MRVINTACGSAAAGLALIFFGVGLVAILAAVAAAILVAMVFERYPANWRLGPATVVIVMAAAASGKGLEQELELSLLRQGEMFAFSAIALLGSSLYSRWLAEAQEPRSR